MKFSLEWLKDYLETDASVADIASALNRIGHEVEGIEDPADKLAGFRVAHVLTAGPHPDADKLQVLSVDTGEGDPLQVVCGAPNARAGMKGVLGLPGAVVPANGMELRKSAIRGVESNGMMCSVRELELGEEHDGIIELPGDAPVGANFAEYHAASPILDVAITPDRPDCMGVMGIARDLAAAGLGTYLPVEADEIAGEGACPVEIRTDDAEGCPAFYGRVIRGVSNGASPEWMQRRLKAAGQRPISALVDCTNYLMLSTGRPAHVYDLAKLSGAVTARRAKNGETVEALNEKTYTLDDTMTVIADDAGVHDIAGIMGGEHSGAGEDTSDVLLEIAYFDPTRIGVTGRKLGLASDARTRFERGVDPAFLEPAMEIATRLVMEFCGGEPSHVVVAGGAPDWQKSITLRHERVRTLGGVDLDAGEVSRILKVLGFSHARKGDSFETQVPSWRPDIVGEACLVEEVVRIHGYDNIPAEPMSLMDTLPHPARTVNQTRRVDARRVLASRGMTEAVTYSFLAEKDAALFGEVADAIKLANPISADLDVMRGSILPNLINAAVRNGARGIADTALFEVGPQFTGDQPDDQTVAATGIRTGNNGIRHWAGKPRPVDAFDAKADVIAVLDEIGIATDRLQISTETPAYFHPARSGTFQQGPKNKLAYFGDVHPRILKALDIAGPVAAFEILLDNLPKPKRKKDAARAHLMLSAYQKVSRDFAFLVDTDVTAVKVAAAASQADKQLITETEVFDVFAGGNVEAGKKSLALSVTLQAMDRTLTDVEIDAVADKVVANVAKATGATLRG